MIARTIRARVALATSLLLSLVLALAATIIVLVVRASARASLDHELLTEAEAVAALVHDGRVDFRDELMPAFVSSATGAFFQVSSGGKVVGSPSLGSASLPSPEPSGERASFATAEDPEGKLRIVTLSLPGLVVQVARRLHQAEATSVPVRLALGIALPIALVLGGLGAFVVARRATAPIARLSREAQAIDDADLARRLDTGELEGELQDLARTLNGAFDRLGGAVERERRFSSDVSHELRTPLTVLRSETELALSRERTSEEYRATLELVLDETDRLEKIVRALLLLGRAEAGRLTLERLDLRDAIAPREGVRLELPATPVFVRGNASLLERLVGNLVENAVVHGKSDVALTLAVADGRARLVVGDRGPGFPAGFAERAFERFTRGDESRNRSTGGFGLGLAIARAIARAHGGDLEAGTREGGGAQVTFTVTLAKD